MKRAAVVYCIPKAHQLGEHRHPGVVMRLAAHYQGFLIVTMEEQVLAEVWTFEIETFEPELPTLPGWCETRPHR